MVGVHGERIGATDASGTLTVLRGGAGGAGVGVLRKGAGGRPRLRRRRLRTAGRD
ncbi:hypothetical protein ABZX40_27765 [Streptomyces sp. NPDC004610]|uniref:hypothetical protein n=1 Tax=unclassified Streptomyces TaxID=2593676 RepID=UPI0033AFE4E1